MSLSDRNSFLQRWLQHVAFGSRQIHYYCSNRSSNLKKRELTKSIKRVLFPEVISPPMQYTTMQRNQKCCRILLFLCSKKCPTSQISSLKTDSDYIP
mmetsp:Transcript_12372/g.18135  ORF Transcript_12372/g.18135 Transcript_12372/m.18135 type:complete len:97 (-) Transcript_12372:1186-1476(-)